MANLKHIGRVSNTGLKCIVVFREMYDEHGKVLDPNHCLIVETERLPDMEHDDIVRVVESDSTQESAEFFNVAQRNKFSDGANMLSKLSDMSALKSFFDKYNFKDPDSFEQEDSKKKYIWKPFYSSGGYGISYDSRENISHYKQRYLPGTTLSISFICN